MLEEVLDVRRETLSTPDPGPFKALSAAAKGTLKMVRAESGPSTPNMTEEMETAWPKAKRQTALVE